VEPAAVAVAEQNLCCSAHQETGNDAADTVDVDRSGHPAGLADSVEDIHVFSSLSLTHITPTVLGSNRGSSLTSRRSGMIVSISKHGKFRRR